ncbi:MAG TPA: carbon starvation protein A [Candidatus Mediterraneibacter pullicola]|uniref:Carbon starvation protein A n=1 Tax=Candidatus Mediterraneibacter pullicola TaxID=2838682 RepID=A0A9D2H8I7_9FIRM|nr:carbon starvation protein A [Candidatus Mediterraneibacter pullicola]
MITFIIGLVILFVGSALYGKFCEKVFGPDDRKTPAYTKQDGIDYVPMKEWKNSLINLLNIAGTGPILGPIQGILFGPIAFITIPIGNVIGGAMHDYFSGMICLRDGGTQMPTMIRRYSNKGVYTVYQIFCSLLLLLVGAVFIYTPGDIAATQVFGFDGAATSVSTWVIYGVIFAYYLIATVFPIDKIIGRIYPVFGAILLFSALGVFIGLFVHGYPLTELWDDWNGGLVAYGDYFDANHFIPIFFITVACGILSGFHSTQTAIISRTMKSEKQGRMTFYNMMTLEGFIAMVWAAGAMGIYNLGIQAADASLATASIGVICRDLLGPIGGIIAIVGVIVLPITSGDTALRSLRLAIADAFHLDQTKKAKRLGLAAVIFALVAVILVFAKINADGFNILWRYFAWSNQSLSLFAFLAITVWMFETGRAKYVWIPLIPGAWYTFITVTYIVNAKIGFNVPWMAAYIIGVVAAAAYVAILVWYGKKRSQMKARKSGSAE